MNREGLAGWVRFFAAMAAPKALLTLIHRPDCLGELLPLLAGRFGDIAVFPLFPKRGEPATRIIVQAEKGSRAGLSLLPGLVLHEADGSYTAEAEAVLRGGGGSRSPRQRQTKGAPRGALRRHPAFSGKALGRGKKPKGHSLSGMALCQTRSALGGARA